MSDGSPWEPDPRRMGNWRAMFDQPRGAGPAPTPAASPPHSAPQPDADTAHGYEIDPHQYRPWMLQRGSSRPPLMLALRRYDGRSGLWQGWGLAYPSLQAVDYLGDRMVSLDFGHRQFLIEGAGLDALVERLQLGTVVVIQEYCAAMWPARPPGPFVQAIKRVSPQRSSDA